MARRASKLWKDMTPEQRLAAATAFWEEAKGSEGWNQQHVEALLALAKRLNFRPKSIQALPVEKRSRYLAGLPEISDGVAGRALVAYHLSARRPMMVAFLDLLGVAHENGIIGDEARPAFEPAKLAEAAAGLGKQFPPEDVWLYLNTLLTQDPDTWGGLEAVPQAEK
jgi:hypothetical protein